MNAESYDDQDGKRVWLATEEIDQLLNQAAGQQRLALELAVRSGLRSIEVVQVKPNDIADTQAGPIVRIREEVSKTDAYRETPIPREVAEKIWYSEEMGDVGSDEPVIDRSTRTLRRWISGYGETLADETGEDLWREVGFHDLRRTWANQLRFTEVEADIVCQWGGWSDLETFLEHYRGAATPEAQQRARQKVEWLRE